MKRPITLLTGISICIVAALLIPLKKNIQLSFENEKDEPEEQREEREAGVDKQMNSWFQSRGYPDPYYLDSKYEVGWEQAKLLKQESNNVFNTRMQSVNWTSLGPNTGIGGRILSITVNPAKGSSIYIGTAGGGIWKSYNSAASWQPVTTGFPVVGVPTILINPSDTNVLYAGTGEVYRIDSIGTTPAPGNTGYSVWKTRGTYGCGILKSTNGGYSWTRVMQDTMSALFGVQKMRFDPTNFNTVYACTTDGLYQSLNAGSTWNKILDTTYVSDVVINAKNNNQIVVSVGNLQNTLKGILRSTDGGATWSKITTGLPASINGMTKLENLPTLGNRDTIIASIGVSETATTELYRSTNFGASWTGLNSSGHTQWQYWCAHALAIKPSNSNFVIYGGVKLRSYTISTQSASGTISIHDDIHDIEFDPSNNNIVYVACDGGMYKSTNGGASYSSANNGLAATQFYATIGVSKSDANLIVGGLQDNGVIITTNGGTTWTTMPGGYGDGASCAIDPTNDNNILASGDARNVYLSTDRGASASNSLSYWGQYGDSRTAFNSPLGISKSNPLKMYVASDNWHVSTDGGSTFTGNALGSYPPYPATTPNNFIEKIHRTAVTLAISPTNANKVYVSTSPFAQADNDVDTLYYDRSLGNNVLRTTTGNTPFTSKRTGLPDRFVNDFAVSAGNDDSVFAVLGGFGTSHVYVTGNGGTSWTSAGNGLPDVPFNAIVFDPVNPKIIYAGCDLGVYVSTNRGLNWADYNSGFWDGVMVIDLQITADNKLLAATHGKGIFKIDLYAGILLPVTLVNFYGENNGNYNELTWVAEQETNLSGYELERSSDGLQFQKVTRINSRSSAGPTTYKYSDAIGNSSSSYFYRIKYFDNNGTYKYSNVVFLKKSQGNQLQVLQNPFVNTIDLKISLAQNGNVQIHLFDASGKLLRKEQPNLNSGQTIYKITDLDNLPSGIYFIEAIINDQRWRQKIIKK